MLKKTKVAILLHGLGANGIDTLFANLSKKWDLDRFEITYLLAVDKDAKQFWEDDVASYGVKVVHITDLDGKKLIKWPVNLYKVLKELGPFDAIHVNMDMLNGINLFVAKIAGIRNRICHAHSSSNEKESHLIKKIIKTAYLFFMKKMISIFATEKIACSDLAGEYFYGKNKYKILYNGIDLDLYKKKSFNSSEEIRFVTIGRMSEVKNPFFIIDIIEAVLKLKSNVKMIWVGSGVCEKQIKDTVRKKRIEDKFEFLGIRSDVNNILKECDYFLLPSKYEGLSLALAEAQATGLDCFVSDTVSRLSDCGKCMFISLTKSATEWADIIIEYIDSSEKMILDINKLDLFDISETAKRLEKMYISEKVINL